MNNHNRYCKNCYTPTVYLYHIDGIPWSTCTSCNEIFHLYATMGEGKFYKLISKIRNKRIDKILPK